MFWNKMVFMLFVELKLLENKDRAQSTYLLTMLYIVYVSFCVFLKIAIME